MAEELARAVRVDGPAVADASGSYTIRDRVTVAEAPNLRVRVLSLSAGQCVPWHLHNHITDTFVCLQGPMQVETRVPRAVHTLAPGEMCAAEAKTPHYVHGLDGGPCRFLIVQGVGEYDYVPVTPQD